MSILSTSLKEKMDRSINDGMDYSGDAAVGSFFSSDYKRHDDLKQMLDSNRDNLKLEAMKRIIGMVAKGRDASDLFPAVVKNVVSKNTEVKKLVYVYLVRYAEEQQDLALLSISTFQRALKDPNQLIRASALRVLSSIRVPVIVPIVMLAIRDSAADMSPYVRKTAAHAIPKLYSLDPDQKDELVTILDKLLADRTTLVVGSAVMAFDEVCPERIDLIHKNYRKLCALLVDVDEWGQVVILNMLTRYARTQFVDPNIGDLTIEGEERPFYEDENGQESDDEDKNSSDDDEDNDDKDNSRHGKQKGKDTSHKSKKPQMDPDHRLLLKNSRPLLQSRNASVVMAVAQMYHHVAPKSEVHVVIKALIRLLRSHTEVQAVVLTCIAAMSTSRKSLFEPYMKSFFVRSSDPTQIKLLKLEILTNIANETNIPPILREFQTYISSQDKEFVAAAIQAIGRCASNIKEVAETCLNGLVSLLSHRDPAVVGGAVVVAKTLLQTQRSGNKTVIAQLAKMVDRVTVAPARAAILWLLGEHCERLPNLPPDVLRKMAKTFPDEDDIVKLQIINLAAKLQLINPSQTTLLCQYVLNMAKYDQSYDIRDRARFIRQLLFPENPNSKLSKYAKKILLSSKPAPVLQSKFKDRDHYQLGSLSHFLNTRAVGYQDLPDFPLEAPDSTVRNVEPPKEEMFSETSKFSLDALNKKGSKGKKKQSKKRSFYSESEGSGSEKSEGSESGSGTSSSSSGSGSGSGSSSGTEDSESDSDSAVSEKSKESGSAGEEEKKNAKRNDHSIPGAMKNAGNGSSDHSKDSPATAKAKAKQERKVVRYKASKSSNSNSEDENERVSSVSSTASSSSESSTSSSSDSEADTKKKTNSKKSTATANQSAKGKVLQGGKPKKQSGSKGGNSSNVELLLDLDLDGNDAEGTANSAAASNLLGSLGGELLSPLHGAKKGSSPTKSAGSIQSASPVFIPTKTVELLSKIVSGGLHVLYRFTRAPHLFSTNMVSLELTFHNQGKETIKDIRLGQKTLPTGMSVHDFVAVEELVAEKMTVVTLGIDYNDTTQGAKMEILWATEVEPKKQTVTIKAPIGELIRPVTMSESLFLSEQGKLRGMNEHEAKTFINSALTVSSSYMSGRQSFVQRVYETANLLQVPSTEDDLVRFAGQSLSSQTLVLVTIHLGQESGQGDGNEDNSSAARIVVNCEKIVIGSMLLQELKEALK